jgi:hypothetical protein
MEKSSTCLPSEGKSNNLPHVPTLGHVKDPSFCSCWLNSFRFLPSLIEASRVGWCGVPLEITEGTISDVGHKGPAYIRPRCITRSRINQSINSLMVGQLGPKHVEADVLKHKCDSNELCSPVGPHCNNTRDILYMYNILVARKYSLHCVQRESGVQPISYLVGSGASSSDIKWEGNELTVYCQLVLILRTCRATPPFSPTSWCYVELNTRTIDYVSYYI